jgi:hypothetical protein
VAFASPEPAVMAMRVSRRYMIYGRSDTLQAERLIDLFNAFETFMVNSRSATGNIVVTGSPAEQRQALESARAAPPQFELPWPFMPPALPVPQLSAGLAPLGMVAAPSAIGALENGPSMSQDGLSPAGARAALQFVLSPQGQAFRAVLLDEIVKSIDSLSRGQLRLLADRLHLSSIMVPVLLPGGQVRSLPLSPDFSEADRQQVEAVAVLMEFLSGAPCAVTQ